MLSLVSALLVSSFYIASASASDNNNQERKFKNHRGDFSEERSIEMRGKFKEWSLMTLEEWKTKQIERINNMTEEEFEKMKQGQRGLMMGKLEKGKVAE